MIQRYPLLLFSLVILLLSIHSSAQDPTHYISNFDNLPARLFFFDDTEVAVYFDILQGDVHISNDEGKSWARADSVPSGVAVMVIEHPFNNQYAFILSKGKTHYVTADRGKTWRPFQMPAPPAMVARPLSFHSDKSKFGFILYQGVVCETKGWSRSCRDDTYYTKEAFTDEPQLLLSDTTRCLFAHSSPDFKHSAPDNLIYCIAFDARGTILGHDVSSSRLYSSSDWFDKERTPEDLGIGEKNSRGVVAFAIVSKFAVVALRDIHSTTGEMLLYVTVDTKTWAKGQFPHASSAKLRENAYTIVESTSHSLGVDVVLQDRGSIGTLFLSNSNGTFFVESLQNTNRNEMGFVDFENLYGVEGVGLANVVSNAEAVEGRGEKKEIRSVITFDDGHHWSSIKPPSTDSEGKQIRCNPNDADKCSLHFHSVTTPHNFGRVFSSPAPGFVMAVGSIGSSLASYEDSDTFLSTDAGVTWTMVRRDASKYEFGDSGSLLVTVGDEEAVNEVSYSMDEGTNWKTYNFGVNLRARALLTIPDSTSQKFLLLGQVARKDQSKDVGRFVVVFLDFAQTRKRKCGPDDFEKWYARQASGKQCIMGHKQWYNRRKPKADCFVGEKYSDPVEHEDNCTCDEEDYECDYNFIQSGDKCVPSGREPIPADVCRTGSGDEMYEGSSGYRKIPGNTCTGGVEKDKSVRKSCDLAKPEEGVVTHQTFEFDSLVVQHAYFKDSTTILARLKDNTIWQSSNEGYTWDQLQPGERFLGFYHHPYANDRAYLLTPSTKYFYTTDSGRNWYTATAPTTPNSFSIQVIHFHPNTEWLIWTGNEDCDAQNNANCHARAHYSLDHGRKWYDIDSYVRTCMWAEDTQMHADHTMILCESYKDKRGYQNSFGETNPRKLVAGSEYYRKRTELFEHVVGFTKFSEFLLVAELHPQKNTLGLQVSLDAKTFATGMFPPSMHPESHAYTVLESSTKAVFLHMTMSEDRNPPWGNILKSNSNGTYFGLSAANVNRDGRGLVDFEKMIGLDGIALINVVSNIDEAPISGRKILQSRITHNDGSTWKPLNPPLKDSLGQPYECNTAQCTLHVHGYTERFDPRATYSSPSVVGLVMAVGNVGQHLAPYTSSDTFMSRDGGFTWQEIRKDAHLWEFGDSGSVLVMANDEEPTDYILYSTDEGLNWTKYMFTSEKVRVRSIVTVPSDTSRRFILFGSYGNKDSTVAIHLDFSSLTYKECVLNVQNGATDDFELWSPSEERAERCLFGRQTLYHRRIRDAECVVGLQEKEKARIVKNCECTAVDFECEFNHVKNANDECVLVPGTSPLPDDDSCRNEYEEESWYERTAYRKIAFSTCEGGHRPDRGKAHRCPGLKGHGFFFWFFVLLIPVLFACGAGWAWVNKNGRGGFRAGSIRLPGGSNGPAYGGSTGMLATVASVPWFLVGVAGVAWEWATSKVDSVTGNISERRGYRNLPVDEDAQILRFQDEEDD